MQKYTDVVLDKNGKAISGAVISVVTYPDAGAATIYAADGGPAVKSVSTDNNGRFAFYAANGHYSIVVSGTGITPVTFNDVSLFDPTDLSALQIGYGNRTLAAKLGEVVSVKDSPFNAKGDGVTDDAAAIQAAINYCAGDNGKQVFFPAGNYVIGTALKVPNFANIAGCGPSKSRINLQNKPYTGPIFVNATTDAFQFVTIRDLGLRGGSYGIYNTAATQEHLTLERVAFELQTQAGIYSANDWQINVLHNVSFYYCAQGIVVAAGFSNHNNYHSVEFLGITGSTYKAVAGSSEGNNFYGVRFEAGGVSGNVTLDVKDNRSMNFYGGYIENTHNILLRETGAFGTSFDGVHFTGALSGTTPFEFSSDGEIRFGANTWFTPSNGPARMRITGNNDGKLGKNNKLVLSDSKQHQKFVGNNVAIPVGGSTTALVMLNRAVTNGSLTDLQAAYGKLTVIYRRTSGGGVDGAYIAEFPVTVMGIASAAIVTTLGAGNVITNNVGNVVTVSITGTGNGGSMIQAAISGVASGDSAFITWSFEMLSGAAPGYNAIAASLP